MTDRSCAACGRPITITTRNPNRRYCSARCRVADWHARNDRVRAVHAVPNDANAVAPPGNDVPPDANAVANTVTPAADAVPAANGVQRCPHCHGELAVIAVVVPPAAAHVRTPEVTHMNAI